MPAYLQGWNATGSWKEEFWIMFLHCRLVIYVIGRKLKNQVQWDEMWFALIPQCRFDFLSEFECYAFIPESILLHPFWLQCSWASGIAPVRPWCSLPSTWRCIMSSENLIIMCISTTVRKLWSGSFTAAASASSTSIASLKLCATCPDQTWLYSRSWRTF